MRWAARARLRRAEAEQQAGAAWRVGVHPLEHRERALEQVDRLLVGERVQRAVGGALGVVDRLGGIAARRRAEEVVGDLGQVLLDRAAVDLLERLADDAVTGQAHGDRHAGEERVADEHVPEAVLAEAAGHGLDETERGGRVERSSTLSRSSGEARSSVARLTCAR